MTGQRTTDDALAINHNVQDVLAAAGVRIASVQGYGPSGVAWIVIMSDGRKGSIIVTQSDQPGDATEYLHASIALDSMPTYADLALLHHAVYGRKRWAYLVFAPLREHVDIHEFALHLWGRADGAPMMPNFGQHGTI